MNTLSGAGAIRLVADRYPLFLPRFFAAWLDVAARHAAACRAKGASWALHGHFMAVSRPRRKKRIVSVDQADSAGAGPDI
ncbi:hypothetical protein [Paraburkholderia hiiakae]|uniref:hypothetical protein n=1 Tax=Paraburkholderia hiiakae TaxID=1081782 RepID=UPI001917B95D|nr:hypothetical protein [Paraburkholderia hiiakae]